MYLTRTFPVAAAVLLAGGLSACGDRDRGRPDTGRPGENVETGAVPSDTAAAPAAADLSDPNIVALLDHANAADSTAGALAVKKATNPEVKAFAKLMMSEHHALRLQGERLAKRLKVTPEPPPNDPVEALASKETQALQSAPAGAEFDRVYIEQEIAAHEAVLDLAEQAHGTADNGELKALIEQAKPVIQKHLDRAREIQQKLGGNA